MTQQISRAMAKFEKKVIVGSFTNAAAEELIGRNSLVPKGLIGTLHSHANRALSAHMPVADTMIDEWNGANPDLKLSGGKVAEEDNAAGVRGGKTDGDFAYATLQILRNRMLPRDMWPRIEGGAEALNFERRWNQFKRNEGAIDFTDMVEMALRDTSEHPAKPDIMFWDEFQDFTPLEIALVEKWGNAAPHGFMISGDPNQVLYAFKGASPDYMVKNYKELDPSHVRELPKSYRVPRLPQEYSARWIAKTRAHIVANYESRAQDGFVAHKSNYTTAVPDSLLDDVERRLGELVENKDGKMVPARCMIQASCGFHLNAVIAGLRERGIPFHNPYQLKRGDWNPLSGGNGTPMKERLLSFLRPDVEIWGDRAQMWSGEDVFRFASIMKVTGNMHRGAKERLEKHKATLRELTSDEMLAIFTMDALEKIWAGDLDWYVANLTSGRESAASFPRRILKRGMSRELFDKPRVLVGTIHSFKGTEADYVYVFPDLSLAGHRQMNESREARDAIYRMFYVAFTRTRIGLILCGCDKGFSIPFDRVTA